MQREEEEEKKKEQSRDLHDATAISRKVVRKNVHATLIPEGNMGCDQYTFHDTVHVTVKPTFVTFL